MAKIFSYVSILLLSSESVNILVNYRETLIHKIKAHSITSQEDSEYLTITLPISTHHKGTLSNYSSPLPDIDQPSPSTKAPQDEIHDDIPSLDGAEDEDDPVNHPIQKNVYQAELAIPGISRTPSSPAHIPQRTLLHHPLSHVPSPRPILHPPQTPSPTPSE